MGVWRFPCAITYLARHLFVVTLSGNVLRLFVSRCHLFWVSSRLLPGPCSEPCPFLGSSGFSALSFLLLSLHLSSSLLCLVLSLLGFHRFFVWFCRFLGPINVKLWLYLLLLLSLSLFSLSISPSLSLALFSSSLALSRASWACLRVLRPFPAWRCRDRIKPGLRLAAWVCEFYFHCLQLSISLPLSLSLSLSIYIYIYSLFLSLYNSTMLSISAAWERAKESLSTVFPARGRVQGETSGKRWSPREGPCNDGEFLGFSPWSYRFIPSPRDRPLKRNPLFYITTFFASNNGELSFHRRWSCICQRASSTHTNNFERRETCNYYDARWVCLVPFILLGSPFDKQTPRFSTGKSWDFSESVQDVLTGFVASLALSCCPANFSLKLLCREEQFFFFSSLSYVNVRLALHEWRKKPQSWEMSDVATALNTLHL